MKKTFLGILLLVSVSSFADTAERNEVSVCRIIQTSSEGGPRIGYKYLKTAICNGVINHNYQTVEDTELTGRLLKDGYDIHPSDTKLFIRY